MRHAAIVWCSGLALAVNGGATADAVEEVVGMENATVESSSAGESVDGVVAESEQAPSITDRNSSVASSRGAENNTSQGSGEPSVVNNNSSANSTPVGADANATQRPDLEYDDHPGVWEKGSDKAPRFTWEGCACMQQWRLIGHQAASVTDYCGNPDDDPGGNWCFVMNGYSECQNHMNWGYCSPALRCQLGTVVRLELSGNAQTEIGYVESFVAGQVSLRLQDRSLTTVEVTQLTTVDGEPCVQRRTIIGVGQELGTVGGHTTTLSVATPEVALAPTSMPALTQQDDKDSDAGSAPSADDTRLNSTLTPSAPRPRYDPIIHGPALSLRLNFDFADVLRARSTFERAVIRAVNLTVHQPDYAIEVLSLMRGSVIVVVGVVPDACIADHSSASACEFALIAVRQRWEASLWEKDSQLSDLLGVWDPMFPPFLDGAECVRQELSCTWVEVSGAESSGAAVAHSTTSTPRWQFDGSQPSPCGSYNPCGQPVEPSGRQDPWWFMSLIAFAGATPTCLCLGLITLKVVVRLCRCMRRRRHMQEVLADTNFLPRIEVSNEDLHVGEDWICSICLGEQSTDMDLLLLPCKHTLHYDCMLEWLHHRLSCPMCRTPFRLRDCAIYTTPSPVSAEVSDDVDCDACATDVETLAPTTPTTIPKTPKASGSPTSQVSSVPSLPNAVCSDEDDFDAGLGPPVHNASNCEDDLEVGDVG